MKPSDGMPTAYEYTTFPRRFVSYRWFKPILVILLTGVFMVVFQVFLVLFAIVFAGDPNFVDSIGSGYDDMNPFTGPGALAELGSIAVLLPALAFAVLIVRDRPYSSYSSSRGGWNWGAFVKCLGVAVALLAVITLVQTVLFPDEGPVSASRFTMAGLVMCAVLVPLQCLAEEYIFRGLIMQTVGAWTKLPALAIVVSAALFALAHPYNDIGMITIFCNGLIWGTLAWRTKGLEATSAIHIANNMIAFGIAGFGLTAMTSEIDVASLVVDVLTNVVFAVLIVVAEKKFGWFTTKYDGAEAFNRKKLERIARKQGGTHAAQEQPLQQAVGAAPVAGIAPEPPLRSAASITSETGEKR